MDLLHNKSNNVTINNLQITKGKYVAFPMHVASYCSVIIFIDLKGDMYKYIFSA